MSLMRNRPKKFPTPREGRRGMRDALAIYLDGRKRELMADEGMPGLESWARLEELKLLRKYFALEDRA